MLLLYVIAGLLLAMGSGLIIIALLRLERREDLGRMSEGWRRRNAR